MLTLRPSRITNNIGSKTVQYDLRLRAAAMLETVHYRQAVEAALLAGPVLKDRAEQLSLI
jgi:hypothetical protein